MLYLLGKCVYFVGMEEKYKFNFRYVYTDKDVEDLFNVQPVSSITAETKTRNYFCCYFGWDGKFKSTKMTHSKIWARLVWFFIKITHPNWINQPK